MQNLAIVLKYPLAAKMWRVWAGDENSIDFRHDRAAGDRCTACYAASELRHFLLKGTAGLKVTVCEQRPANGLFVELEIEGQDDAGAFELKPSARGLKVIGHGRNGLLNGCYELLRIQGWRWLEPGIYGECAPRKATLDFLKAKGVYRPSFRHRLVDQYRESDDSMELLRWFSRNRINVVFYKPATVRFADKLGMLSRTGGHLLQKLLATDRPMEDGRTIWEAHPEWYGLPANGKRVKERATRTQPCLSNKELVHWLSRQVCTILQTELKDIDILDLWGFDGTAVNRCNCPDCAAYGNCSDWNLKLLSDVEEYLKAHLDRPVMLNTVSYDNSGTMIPPSRPVPKNLIETGCMVIFYPIHRCYRHHLGDRECDLNRIYAETLEGWHKNAPNLSFWAGEYYNVSKHEDLPLVFGKLIPEEMRYYHAQGCTGATYMHNFSPTWGVRALSQLLHTQFAWKLDTDETAFIDEYFRSKYGFRATAVRKAYARLKFAGKDITQWRNESGSVLVKLLKMEGDRPQEELTTVHYASEQELLAGLAVAVKHADQAVRILRKALLHEQERNWRDLMPLREIPPQVVPTDLEKVRYYDKMEYRLGEDLRGAIYMAESLRILHDLLAYHNALRLGKGGRREWSAVEATASRLNEMYEPVTYEKPGPGVMVKDALTRSQLRMCITRCRGARIRGELN